MWASPDTPPSTCFCYLVSQAEKYLFFFLLVFFFIILFFFFLFFLPPPIFNSGLSTAPTHCTATEIILPARFKDSTGQGERGGSHGTASAGCCQNARAWQHIPLAILGCLGELAAWTRALWSLLNMLFNEYGRQKLCDFSSYWNNVKKLWDSWRLFMSKQTLLCRTQHISFETYRKVILITSPIPYVSGSSFLIWSYPASVWLDSKHQA